MICKRNFKFLLNLFAQQNQSFSKQKKFLLFFLAEILLDLQIKTYLCNNKFLS